MSAGVGSNYMSNGAILAWVTAQQDRLYADLKDSMTLQELQGEMTSDLADIKQHMAAANKDPEQFVEVEAELKAFEEKYGSVPELGEVVESIRGLQVDVSGRLDAVRNSDSYQQQLTDYNTAMYEYADGGSVGDHPVAPKIVMAAYSEVDLKSWTDAIDGKLEGAGTNEKLGMIKLNEINSAIDQGVQQASQLMKSSQDTISAIIHNLA